MVRENESILFSDRHILQYLATSISTYQILVSTIYICFSCLLFKQYPPRQPAAVANRVSVVVSNYRGYAEDDQ